MSLVQLSHEVVSQRTSILNRMGFVQNKILVVIAIVECVSKYTESRSLWHCGHHLFPLVWWFQVQSHILCVHAVLSMLAHDGMVRDDHYVVFEQVNMIYIGALEHVNAETVLMRLCER